MYRNLLVVLLLFALGACHKNNGTGGTNPPITLADSNSSMTISIDPSIGAVVAVRSGDSFLVKLKDPGTINSIPVVYNMADSTKASSGGFKEGHWRDTVDLFDNKVKQITVTAKSGKKSQYWIAFQYIIENHNFKDQALDLCFKGDTLFVATESGLFMSRDDGATYSIVASLGSQPVFSVYVKDNVIYTGLSDAVAISRDGGMTFSIYDFSGSSASLSIQDVCGQNDQIYAVTYEGIQLSRNGGTNFETISDFVKDGYKGGISCIAVSGDTVYVGTRWNLYISLDGGQTFAADNNLLKPGERGSLQCNGLLAQNGVLYVAQPEKVSISTDGGKNFSHGLESVPCNVVCVRDSLIAVATDYGLAISTDKGQSYAIFPFQSGVAGGLAGNHAHRTDAVAIKGKNIYSGFVSGYISILRPR